MQFEKRNNLPTIGKLDSKTFAALTQSTTPASIGSSTPHQQVPGQTNMTPTQTMPGQMSAPGAGGNGAAGATPGAGGTQH
jgi:hypothetical protein